MKIPRWQLLFGGGLLLATGLLYGLHYYIFRDAHHIFLYLLGDIAFLPVDVLIVTLVIHNLLMKHEKRSLLQKMNMVIGSFYSEAGTELLKHLASFDGNIENSRGKLRISAGWMKKDFEELLGGIRRIEVCIKCSGADLSRLNKFLSSKRDFFLLLLENPNLMEHDAFTDLLWAVLHVSEELSFRKDLEGLSDADLDHLSGDIKRAYLCLLEQWVLYMQHLKDAYPYLYSLSVRTNPFNPDSRAEIG